LTPANSRPTRVLHIIKTLGLGGAETNLLNLARAFDPARIETHVAYSEGGEIEPRFRAAGGKLFKYASASHRIKSPHTFPIVARLARYVRSHGIDVVQTHNFNAHVWGLVAGKLAGARVVEHVHDFRYTPTDELVRRHGLMDQYRFIRYFRGRSDRIVVLTDAHRDYVVANGFAPPESVVKIPNGIPLDVPTPRRDEIRAGLGIPDDAVVALTSARMDPSKNIELVVRVAAEVVKRVPDMLFLVAGSGSHLDDYVALARRLGVERQVRFLGFRQDVDALLAAADVFVLPSFLELHSIAILEAMRTRVPIVISSGVGCNDDFVRDGVDGFLCDPFVDAPWVEALVALGNDRGLRARTAERAFDTCRQRFDLPIAAGRFEELYASLRAPSSSR
jgi:glycosyltransferase involved in cell wall biosynthesis